MRVVVDKDDCLFPFIEPFLNFYNRQNKTMFSLEDMKSYRFPEVFGITFEDAVNSVNRFYSTKYFKNINSIRGAYEVILKIKEENDLFVVTSRPKWVSEISESWLSTHFPNCFNAVHFVETYTKNARKKSEVALGLEATLAIEDSDTHAIDLADNDVRVLMPRYPWNTSVKHPLITPVGSWEEIGERIERNDYRLSKNDEFFK